MAHPAKSVARRNLAVMLVMCALVGLLLLPNAAAQQPPRFPRQLLHNGIADDDYGPTPAPAPATLAATPGSVAAPAAVPSTPIVRDTRDSSWLKWVAFAVLPVEAYLGVLLLAFRRYSVTLFDNIALSILNCFAGGVFVTLGLMHLIPDALESQDSAYPSDYPLASLFVVIGFYLLFFFQRILPRAVAALADVQISSKSCCNTTIVYEDNCAKSCQCGIADVEKPAKGVDPLPPPAAADIIPRGKRIARLLAPITLMCAMVLHAFLEGLALGITRRLPAVATLFIGLAVHKWVESIALTTRFVKAGAGLWSILLSLFPFAIIAPIGIVVGMQLGTNANPWASMIMDALVAGVFLYIGAFEIVMDEFGARRDGQNNRWWWMPLLFMGTVAGVGLVAGLMVVG